jgi:hypothetical protein
MLFILIKAVVSKRINIIVKFVLLVDKQIEQK